MEEALQEFLLAHGNSVILKKGKKQFECNI